MKNWEVSKVVHEKALQIDTVRVWVCFGVEFHTVFLSVRHDQVPAIGMLSPVICID